MLQFDISFVIIEYHCLEDLKKCINSILGKCKDISCQIVISSNSLYSMGKREEILGDIRGVKWIFNEENLGFSRSINVGLSNTSGKSVVVMNPDVKILNGGILSAYKYLMTQPDVGVIGPKIVDKDGNIQDSCRKFMKPSDLFARLLKRLFLKKDVLISSQFNYSKIQSVDWVIGAFMMAKREAIEKVGLLDERFFLYVEDMDWCKRFWDSGLKVVYYPGLVVEYKGDRKSISSLMSWSFINKYFIYHISSYTKYLIKHKFKLYT